jgi:hypothetical protein
MQDLPEDESVVYSGDNSIRGMSVHTIEEAMIEAVDASFVRAGAGLK